MSSILKVDTIQDQSGNNIINESNNVITIGASGDTITVPAGATVSGFTSAGIDDNATSTAITISSAENVGIGGAPSSTQRLIVNGDGSNIIGGIEFRNASSGGSTASIGMASGTSNALSIAVNDAANMVFKNSSGTERMRITSAGLVGIGTSSPTHTLDVVGDAQIKTADNSDTLTLVSTDADANSGPNLRLYRNSGSPADDDIVGRIDFEGRNNNSQDVIYANMQSEIMSVADGSEDGQLQFGVMKGGTLRNALMLDRVETVFNEDSVDIDFRVESDGNANMLFVNAGTNRVGIGEAVPLGTLHVKSGDSGVSSPDITDLVVESSSNGGISLLGATNGQVEIAFGDSGDANIGRIAYNHNGNYLATVVNASEATRIHSNGVLSASAGVALGVGTANTASNVLDDYEEGTWTPGFVSGTGGYNGSGISIASGTATYTKIGREVNLYCSFSVTNGGSISVGDSLRFTGQPFTPATPYTQRMGVGSTNQSVGGNAIAVGIVCATSDNPGSMRFVVTQVNGSVAATVQTHFNMKYPT